MRVWFMAAAVEILFQDVADERRRGLIAVGGLG